MDFFLIYIPSFLVLLTVLVFVHEFGHYWVARRCGVRIEVFSIGFGPELFGWTDKANTRWKVSAIPLGGYVKMFGEGAYSGGGAGGRPMTEEDRAESFSHKSLGKRAAVVFAGPAANYLFAIVVLAGLFMAIGQPYTPASVGTVVEGSAAGGLVSVKVTCAYDCTEVKIAPEAAEDPEMLEDLVRAAMNEALRKARDTTKENMGELAQGLPIPPGLIPGM